jgi:hypothetical protein
LRDGGLSSSLIGLPGTPFSVEIAPRNLRRGVVPSIVLQQSPDLHRLVEY